MTTTLLQLNIQGGRVLKDVISYILDNDFTIVQLQEVTGGAFSQQDGVSDIFTEIREKTGYSGVLAKAWEMNDDPSSYFGNATFYKPSLTLLDTQIIYLKPFERLKEHHETPEIIRQLPRNALAAKFSSNGQSVWLVNAHLAWGPTPLDEPYKVKEGMLLYDFLKQLDSLFVLSGDFNVTKDSEIVKKINTLAFNHAERAGITNTLNPHLHRVAELFPKGLAVDFLYTSPGISFSDFQLITEPDLSDHLGLSITLNL